ncbi:MAG: helix-turn-helix transcriptional regulator [Gemmatimonadales bacterium]
MDAVATFPIAPRSRFRGHEHPSVHVCAVLDGGFVERDGRGWRDVGAGWVRVSAGARHDIDFGPSGARCLVLEADPGTAAPRLQSLPRPLFLETDSWLGQVLQHIDGTASQRDPEGAIALDSLAAELLAQLERRLDGRRSPPPPWLRRVCELVHDLRGMVTVAALARAAGVHRVHLARTFRDHFGVPVTAYARRVRLDYAQRLLVTSATPLAQVAARAGFADQSHLTRVMRATLGVTPGAVRGGRLHPFKTAPGGVL